MYTNYFIPYIWFIDCNAGYISCAMHNMLIEAPALCGANAGESIKLLPASAFSLPAGRYIESLFDCN